MSAVPQPPGPIASRGKIPWPLVISFFLFLNFLFLIVSTGRVHTIDEVSADYQAESLVLHGTTAVPQAVQANWFYGEIDRFGQPQSPYPPGQAVASIPWFMLGQFAARHFPGVPAAVRDLVGDFFLTGSSAAYSALAATLALLIFLRLNLPVGRSLAAAGILALATPLASYSAWFFSEPLGAALLLGAAAVLFTGTEDVPVTASQAAAAGALLGAAIWVRPTHLLAALVFLVALFVRDRKRAFAPAVVFAAVVCFAGVAYLWRNVYLFGHPFDFGYPAAAENGKALNTFHTPFTTGLFGYLFSPGKSIFIFAPPIVLSILGLRALWRRSRGLATVAALTPIIYILFFATYTQWEGGYSYGPRYLVPALALGCLGLGPALAQKYSWVRASAIGLFMVGFAVQGLGVATSFLEAAVRGGYYDATYTYRMSFAAVWLQGRLVWIYVTSPVAASIGNGFDRWWLLLAKAGVAHGTLWAIGIFEFAGAALSAWALWRNWRRLERR
ncbi:MAG: hypothetical protein ABSA32_11090 [Candidatus Acidiferrales bacterium]|jgi:hypothetical protein